MISAAERVLARHPGFLNASAMGTGKTRGTAAFCHKHGISPLVVCPKTLISSWKDEFALWGMEPMVVNYERIRGKALPKNELVIWDEAQALSGNGTLQAKLLKDSVARGGLNILISATLADNPLKMKTPGYALGLHHYFDFWTWARNNGCGPGLWGGLEFHGHNDDIRGIHASIFPHRGVRIRYEEIPEFPAIQIVPELIDFSANLQKIYAEMAKDLSEVPATKRDDMDVVILTRARQKTELLKVPEMVSITEGLVEEGFSVCLFVNFLDTVDALHKRLEGSVTFTGQNVDTREAGVIQFNANQVKVIVLSLQAGGPGLNLPDLDGNHQRVSLISPGFRAEHVIQATGRTHRGNSKSPSIVRFLFAKGTVEEAVWHNVKAKANRISLLNDNDLTFV